MKYSTLFFDLDDTLYPKDCGVWMAVRKRIEDYMRERVNIPVEEIPAIRQHYLEHYGTSLRGLMDNYEMDPEDYLVYVHDVPIEDMIRPNPELGEMLARLPQKKWIFTNSSTAHSKRVLAALGIQDYFDGILDVTAMNYRSKPDANAYNLVLQRAGETKAAAAMFVDDQPNNLGPAKKLGAATVLIGSEAHPTADRFIARSQDLLANWPQLVE